MARIRAFFAAIAATALLSACGTLGSIGDSVGSIGSGPFSGGGRGGDTQVDTSANAEVVEVGPGQQIVVEQPKRRSVFGGGRSSTTDGTQVNRYIWQASLDVLNFLPITSADPFTGVITTGYGTPPGGGRSYRVTVLITSPVLEASALNVSVYTSAGPASAETVRAVEDAILTRARQLRTGG